MRWVPGLALLVASLFVASSTHSAARPCLRGPGGLIRIPTAYLSSGGSVSPTPSELGSDGALTTINYPWADAAEFAVQMPTEGSTAVSLKCQLQKDVAAKKSKTTPAAAIGVIDRVDFGPQRAFYGVLSKKMESVAPFVLHLGIMSPGSMFGDVRPFGGVEMPVNERLLLLAEYDGLERNVNSGIEYHITQNVASFLYYSDVDDDGVNARAVTGFTFRMAF